MKRVGTTWSFLAVMILALLTGCGGGSAGTVTPPPPPPPPPEIITITTNPNLECARNVPFSQMLQETGASGTVTWSVISGQLPSGLALDSSTGILSGTPTNSATSGPVTIQAADTKAQGSEVFNFSVFLQLVINPVTPSPAHLNAPYSLSVTGQGSSAIDTWSIVSGQLPPGLGLGTSQSNANIAIISGTPMQTGTFTFTIQATDFTLPQTATLALSIVVDSKLTITKSTLKNGQQNQPYSDAFVAVNGMSPLTWSVSGALPAGLTLNTNTGQVSGTPTGWGGFPFTVTVTDSSPTPLSDSAQSVLNISQPLQIIANLNPAYIGEAYTTPLTATGGVFPYTWAITSGSLPPGLTLQSSGFIIGTPTRLGSYNFQLQVSDSSVPPVSVAQAITLNVNPIPLSVLGSPLSPAPVNVLYHSQIPISGGTPPFTFGISSGSLPPGLALDPVTGFIDGTPTQVGAFNFTAIGTDSGQPQQTATANDFIIIRSGLGRNDSIATATPLGNSAIVNIPNVLSISPYIDPINATTPNPDTDYYRLIANAGSTVHVETFAQRSWGADTLDSVIELLDGNGARLQSCVAPGFTSSCINDNLDATTLDSALDFRVPGAAGTQTTFYVHVFDWRGDARPDMQYYLNISGVLEPLTITSTNIGSGSTRGVNFSQQMTSTGGTGSITWSLDSGTLPSGWTLTPSGLLGGVAITDGTYTFTIRATDSGTPAETARAQFTMIIAEPLVITSSATLPNACANQPYSFTVQTSGGLPPINFGFFSNAWISINFDTSTGTFSGTTNVTGTFTGKVSAQDSARPPSGQIQTITLTVVNCP